MKQEIQKETEFGMKVKVRFLFSCCNQPFIDAGSLVPDDLVLPVIHNILIQPQYRSGVILDGFPRNIAQAEAISKELPIDLVMYFHLPREVLIEKLMGRRVCPSCGRSYNVASIMNNGFNLPPLLPKQDNMCDDCNKPLIQRSDDCLEVIDNRLKVYESHTSPLLEYFGKDGKSIIFGKVIMFRHFTSVRY